MVLFRYILIFLLVYFLINLISKMLFPNRRGNRVYSNDSDSYNSRKEGEVNIQTNKHSNKKRINKDEGEYVKFEDISDNKKD